MATTYLTRTQVAGNRSTFTQSFWFKLSNTGDQALISTFNDSNNYNYCYLDSSTGQLNLQWKKSGSVVAQKNTSRVFRDFSAWYNVVYAVDTTQASGGDRIKLYINGELQTEFSSNIAPGQITTEVNDNGTTQYIGSVDGSQQYFNGSMSYVAQIDGTAELPGIFGETDSTTGEWKIKTDITPSVAWGNNGFLILKNGNSLTDESSNSNNFTLAGGTLTETKDCPDNNFATLNPLYYQATKFSSITNGNTTFTSDSGTTFNTLVSTIGMSSGKYYFEVKRIAERGLVGITDVTRAKLNTNTTYYPGDTNNSVDWGYYSDDGKVYNNGNASGSGATWGNGDIVGCAVDLDNRKIYWHKNGSYINSGNPSTGANGQTISSDVTYYFAVAGYTSTTFNQNFGNGTFGTTAIASAGTNASNNGVFEYDTPTGYTALSTKGLNL